MNTKTFGKSVLHTLQCALGDVYVGNKFVLTFLKITTGLIENACSFPLHLINTFCITVFKKAT
jgi:hypothetical protein